MTHPTPNEPLTEAEQVRTDMAVSALGRIMVLAGDAIKSVTSTLPVVVGAEIKAELARPQPAPAKVAEADIAWLNEAELYFTNRPTNGEDSAHWSNVMNAKNAAKLAVTLASAQAEIDRLTAQVERFRTALAWLDEVHPANLPWTGAQVQMTWEQWNAIRAAMGLPEQQPGRPNGHSYSWKKRVSAAEVALATEVAHQQYTARELAAAEAQVAGLRDRLTALGIEEPQ